MSKEKLYRVLTTVVQYAAATSKDQAKKACLPDEEDIEFAELYVKLVNSKVTLATVASVKKDKWTKACPYSNINDVESLCCKDIVGGIKLFRLETTYAQYAFTVKASAVRVCDEGLREMLHNDGDIVSTKVCLATKSLIKSDGFTKVSPLFDITYDGIVVRREHCPKFLKTITKGELSDMKNHLRAIELDEIRVLAKKLKLTKSELESTFYELG